MNKEHPRHLDITLLVGSIPLIAGGKYLVDGVVYATRSGGIDHTIRISQQVLEEVQRLNWSDAVSIASAYPNEMQALLSFTIAAACGLAALGVGIYYAQHEANLHGE